MAAWARSSRSPARKASRHHADRPHARGGRTTRAGRRNIGYALSAQVDESTDETIHVVEISSFQLEATETFHPWIAVLLNFSAEHRERRGLRRGQVADFREADRGRLGRRQRRRRGDARDGGARPRAPVAVLDGRRSARESWSRVTRSSGVPPRGPLIPLSSIRLLGRHLLADVLAAAAVATLVGVDAAAMTRAVEGFAGLEHALEPVGEVGGVRFVNDSKATNIEAAGVQSKASTRAS